MRAALLLPVACVGLIVALLATASLVDVFERRSIGGLCALLIYGGMTSALVVVALRSASVGPFPRIRPAHLALISLGCLTLLALLALGVKAMSKF